MELPNERRPILQYIVILALPSLWMSTESIRRHGTPSPMGGACTAFPVTPPNLEP